MTERVSAISYTIYKFITTLQLCLAFSLTTVKNVNYVTVTIKITVTLEMVMDDKNSVKL
jgi:hypothetical protein